MLINIMPDGSMESLYSDDIDYEEFSDEEPTIERASNVEPLTNRRGWRVHIIETGEVYEADPRTGEPFVKRKQALEFEVELLEGRMVSDPGYIVERLNNV